MSYFKYIDNKLYVEDISITNIANKIKTPFYCYSSSAIIDNYNRFANAVKDLNVTIAYAIKANPNMAILSLLQRQSCGADIVSVGELKRALKANIPAEKIVFSGVGKQIEEIDFALLNNIRSFNVESRAELIQIAKRAELLNKKAPISIRINPDIDAKTHSKISTGKSENKFGIPLDEAYELYLWAADHCHLEIVGITMHIGSQITQAEPFACAFAVMYDFIKKLQAQNIRLSHIDVGGGLGIPYDSNSEILSVEDYAELIKKYFASLELPIICEPGRYLVANSGILVTSVIFCKKGLAKNFLIVDSGMNDLMRPTLYEAYHEVNIVDRSVIDSNEYLTDIVGPVCETGDYLALSRKLPILNTGDKLVISTTGAYGACMSNSYNSRNIIAEILVQGGIYDVIRPVWTVDQMIDNEYIPSWLD